MKTPKNHPKMSKKQACNKSNKRLALCNTRGKLGKMSDRLDMLKGKCEVEIRETEERLRVLKAKLANLVALALESEKLANPETEPDKYATSGFTEAVLDAVKNVGETRLIGASPVEIKNFLLAHGFKAPENFETAIYTVLGRLVDSGQIHATNIQLNSGQHSWKDAQGNRVRLPPKKLYKVSENRMRTAK